jgi:hypothetical protein
MPASRPLCVLLACVVLSLASPCFGSVQRTFVSGSGNDANTLQNCGLKFPCRSFGSAITVTSPGGEIIVLDSAGYGPVAIGAAISIIAPQGIYAGVSVGTGDGVTIDAGIATVVLHGLSINGLGGNNGITIANAGTVHVENCVISNLSIGINQVAGRLELKDSIVRGNSNVGIVAMFAAAANLDHVRVESNFTGVSAQFGGHVAVHDSVISGSNIGVLVYHDNAGGAPSWITVARTLISDNNNGIYVESLLKSFVTVSDSTISGNAVGLFASNAVQAGNNVNAVRNIISGNGTGLKAATFSIASIDSNSLSGNSVLDVQTLDSSVLFTRQSTFAMSNSLHAPAVLIPPL